MVLKFIKNILLLSFSLLFKNPMCHGFLCFFFLAVFFAWYCKWCSVDPFIGGVLFIILSLLLFYYFVVNLNFDLKGELFKIFFAIILLGFYLNFYWGLYSPEYSILEINPWLIIYLDDDSFFYGDVVSYETRFHTRKEVLYIGFFLALMISEGVGLLCQGNGDPFLEFGKFVEKTFSEVFWFTNFDHNEFPFKKDKESGPIELPPLKKQKIQKKKKNKN